MQFVACKTVRQYNRNQDKIKQFLLTGKRQAKQEQLKAQINTAASTSECPTQLEKTTLSDDTSSTFNINEPGPSTRHYAPKQPTQKKQQRGKYNLRKDKQNQATGLTKINRSSISTIKTHQSKRTSTSTLPVTESPN